VNGGDVAVKKVPVPLAGTGTQQYDFEFSSDQESDCYELFLMV